MQGQGQGPSLQGLGQGQRLDLQGQGQGQGLHLQFLQQVAAKPTIAIKQQQ